jgi:four helix bundle protein
MQNFTQLKVWQKAHIFTVNLYKISSEFPLEEKFGLTNQIRRATISIESNIAEGCGRDGDKEFNRFLSIAKGSCYEVQCQIDISKIQSEVKYEKEIEQKLGKLTIRMSNYTWEYIKQHPQEVQRLLGISYEQLEQLIEQGKLLHQLKQEKCEKKKIRIIKAGGGKPTKLSIEEQIVLTLVYLRHHLTFQILGLIFQVSELQHITYLIIGKYY